MLPFQALLLAHSILFPDWSISRFDKKSHSLALNWLLESVVYIQFLSEDKTSEGIVQKLYVLNLS